LELSDLSGKVALVTGSSRRNGRAIARALASAGASVVINARTSAGEADLVVQEITLAGGRAVACMADIAQEQDAQRLIATALEAFGRLDILVNNAAIRAADPLAEMSFARWREVNGIILDGAFLCAKSAAPHLQRGGGGGGGRIVNIGGISGHKGAVGRAHVVAAKAGLIGLTKALALELAPDVTVNCVSPGRIEDIDDSAADRTSRDIRLPSDLIPLQRSGTTQDVAAAVRFLCSEAAGYITGQVIHVNGGAYIC
jgi:3-oxoacyl-[acyl-carrier protein] reductase